MARFFTEQQIDTFRDCFYIKCKSGVLTEVEELKFIMRSVGLSPTEKELKNYLNNKQYKITFADFLDCAHTHMKVEKVPDEIMKALETHFGGKTGRHSSIKVEELKRIMCDWGEKLSQKEFDTLLKDLKATNLKEISHVQLKQFLIAPKV